MKNRKRKGSPGLLAIVCLLFCWLGLPASATAQKREWTRVRTNDDSIVEMNTTDLARIGEGQIRATFRQTYSQPQRFGRSNIYFISQLELFEFDCVNRQSRPHAVLYLDRAGAVVHYRGADGRREWKPSSGNYYQAACGLLASLDRPVQRDRSDSDAKRAALVAANFWRRILGTRDVAPLIGAYFAGDFLERMRNEPDQEWLGKVSSQTAAQLSPAELRRYYIAVFNAQFLGTLYVIAQSNAGADPTTPSELLVSPRILNYVDHHPYSNHYRAASGDYGYLGETIVDVARAREYTGMLEQVNGLLRVDLGRKPAAHFYNAYEREYRPYNDRKVEIPADVRMCETNCFGLAAGTDLFTVDLPLFRLRLARVNGVMRIVSAVAKIEED